MDQEEAAAKAQILDKYKIHIINGRRYYEYNVAEALPILDNTVPYSFKYKSIDIEGVSSWNKLTLKLLDALDKMNPKSEEYLLNIKYDWSKAVVFSRTKLTNYSPFKNLYVDTNHSSTHCLMSIQCLLRAYGVDPKECFMLIRRYPCAEPEEAKRFFAAETKKEFAYALRLAGKNEISISNIINSFNSINKILEKVTTTFNDFWLFDEYYTFLRHKELVMNKAEEMYYTRPKNIRIIEKDLNYLDEYYKYQDIYSKLYRSDIEITEDFKQAIIEETTKLFGLFSVDAILGSKLYDRMKIMHPDIMEKLGKLSNQSDFYKLCAVTFQKVFYFHAPFICKTEMDGLTQDDLILKHIYEKDEITCNEISSFCERMQLKHPNSYLELMKSLSEDYVQVSQDKIVRKNLIGMDENLLRSIGSELAFYINSFGDISSETYVGYSSLPALNYEWNKYLLLGVVRSFFPNQFNIEYFGNSSRKFEYKISLKNSEN